ncbi:serine threonine protein kinase [Penicillium canescens]|nr:serine threonine protein kinase [Penicillium canescens]
MDRSGRLFSSSFSTFITETQETPASALPGEGSQHYWNLASDDVSQNLQKAARADPDFADVVCAASVYKIKHKTIDNIGVGDPNTSRQTFSIGAGLTSEVVQHMLIDEASKLDPPPATTIALKIFRSAKQGSPSEARAARQKVYDSILREMKAFGHPSLSNHPHVLKLLFVGWNSNYAYPFLAMELGDHGSLDHILRTRGPGPTTRQKRNLTIDIALGLQAIHKAGFIHGDLKPDNIIVFSSGDPARQISAKLSDFGGSNEIYGERDGAPTHFTSLWSAPEVLAKRSKIYWDRADVYSYGLVVASLWANPRGSEEDSEGKDHGDDYAGSRSPSRTMLRSSSVLFGSVPLPSGEGLSSNEDLSSDEDQSSLEDQASNEDLSTEDETPSDEETPSEEDIEGLRYIKCLPESNPESLMSVLAILITRKSLPADINPSEVFAILTPTLRTNWWERPEMDDFMVVISEFANAIGRVVEPLVERVYSEASKQSQIDMYRSNVDYQTYEPKPLRPSALNRDIESCLVFTDHRDIMMSHVFRALDDIDDRVKYTPHPEDIPDHFPEDFSTDQFLASLLAITNTNLRHLYAAIESNSRDDIWSGALDFIKKGCFLRDLGLAGVYGLEPGMALDFNKRSFEYIRTSALYENDTAIITATFALSAGSVIQESEIPIRLNLVLLSLSHSSLAMRRLHSNWPSLYAIVRKVMRERGLSCLTEAKEISPGLHASQRLLRAYINAVPLDSSQLAPLSLSDSLEIGATETIIEIIEDNDHPVPADQEQSMRNLFHKLGKIPDVKAAALARAAYERGASLECPSKIDYDDLPNSGTFQFFSTPLCAALGRGQPLLAFEIFCLHVEFDVPIKQFAFAIHVSFANLYPVVGLALVRLFQDNPSMCLDLDDGTIRWGKVNGDFMRLGLPQSLAAPILMQGKWMSLMLHGGEYRTAQSNTLNLLLDEGADPALGLSTYTPLGLSIVSDDINALETFLDRMEMATYNKGRKTVDNVLLASLNDPCNLARFQEQHLGSEIDWEYMHTALALCIRHASLSCFELVLKKVPSLVNTERDAVGRTLLHRACSGVERGIPSMEGHSNIKLPVFMELIARAGRVGGPGLEFIELLLMAGADVMAIDSMNNSPLYWALRRVNIPAADMIASYCSQDQLKRLLGRDPHTGDSIFAALIETDIDHPMSGSRREPKLVTSLQWLQERGGLHFYGPGNEAVWNTILTSQRTLRIHQLMDATLMEYLIDLPVFAEKLHTERYEGFSMLHLAVMHSNVDIVRLMLARQCDPNVASTTELPVPYGATPLDMIGLSLLLGSQMPTMDTASHAAFIKRHDAMLDIANMLLEKGAQGTAFEALQKMTSVLKGGEREWESLLEKSRHQHKQGGSLKQDNIMGAWPISLPSEDHTAGIPSGAPSTTVLFDPVTDAYLTNEILERAFDRLIERRHGELESSKRKLLLEQLHVEFVRDRAPAGGSEAASVA